MLDATWSGQLLDASLGTSTLVAVVLPVRCRLMVVNGTATGLGTELATGGGYVAGVGAPTVTFAVTVGENTSNNIAVTVANMPACTVVGVELWDSSGTPRRLHLGPLAANKVCNLGDTFNLSSGQLTLALS